MSKLNKHVYQNVENNSIKSDFEEQLKTYYVIRKMLFFGIHQIRLSVFIRNINKVVLLCLKLKTVQGKCYCNNYTALLKLITISRINLRFTEMHESHNTII